MGDALHDLNFSFLDDLALAAARGRLTPATYLEMAKVGRVGPMLELLVLNRGNALPFDPLPASGAADALRRALAPNHSRRGSYANEAAGHIGFVTTVRAGQTDERIEWVAFCRKAQEAAELSLPKTAAQGVIGAMREIEENVYLHSERAEDGIVGFRGTAEDFEFVVADSGIGILNSLRRSPDYQHLDDAGAAIRLALTDGQSRLRHVDPGRGYGFHDLFVGLANLNGELRFRSDDHALTIEGASPSLMAAHLSQKVHLQGFAASVVCSATPTSRPH